MSSPWLFNRARMHSVVISNLWATEVDNISMWTKLMVGGPRHGGGRGGHGPPTLKNLGATGGAEGAIVLGGPGGAKTTEQGEAIAEK